jgi:flagellin
MAAVINTNTASLNAQRNLSSSQAGLTTALQRLSSGLRINSSKDDAAGLAIASRMTSQINGLDQAARNANDGISLAQTAEGSLSSITDGLQRMRTLALQSATSTNSSSDRASLNAEVQSALSEISRVASTTQFNGLNLLDGSFANSQFQVGANANQTITMSIGGAGTNLLGAYQFNNTTSPAAATSTLASGDLTLNGVNVGATATGGADAITAAINAVSNKSGVTATATSTITAQANPTGAQNLVSGDMVINGVDIGAVSGSATKQVQGNNLVTAINAKSNQTGVTATADSSTGALTLTSSTGKTIDVTTNNGNAGSTRTENATGLNVSGSAAAKAVSTFTFASGVAAVNTITSGATTVAANSADTLTVGGVQFTYSAAASSATNINIPAGATGATQAAQVKIALDAAVSAGTLKNVTIGAVAGAAVTVTSQINELAGSASVGVAATTAAGSAATVAATTAGVGLSVGDTVVAGGITYEFTAPSATSAASGHVQVKMGTTDALTGSSLYTAINAQYAAGNSTLQATGNAGGVVTTTDARYGDTTVTGTNAEGTSNGTAGALVVAVGTAGANGASTASTTYGNISLSSASAFQIGGAAPSKAGLNGAAATLNTISNIDISTVAGSNSAISLIDAALSQVNTQRAGLGAIQNRFTSLISNLQSGSENITSARSRIQDTDFAAETASLTRGQILQQAGTAMLAQANSLPNGVLALLR